MKEVDFGKYGKMPLIVFMLWILAAAMSLTALALMILDIGGVVSIALWKSLLILAIGIVINWACLISYKLRNKGN
ncbi:MAG: hypothetical protein J6X94_05900 [Lachnospiraceae bacterium]|nr:hypothetical protein [Lachnospiraceae bacterium]